MTGTLDSTPNTSFLLEFFASGTGSPPEGQTYLSLGQDPTVTTDGAGHASFRVSVSATASPAST